MKCPKCGNELERSGEFVLCDDGPRREFVEYQCGSCVVPWTYDGKTFDSALTMAVDSDGRFYDPQTLDPLDLN